MLSFFQVCFILGTCLHVANANPVGISISGKIVEESTDQVLTGPVAFRVKVLSKDNCILYSEEFTTTLSSTGTFTFTLGKGANSVNAYYPSNPVAGQSVTGMNKLFSNLQPAAVTSLGNGAASGSPMSSDNVACPGTYTPASDDYRKVRIEFDNGDSQGYRAIMPYHQIRTVPYAMIAEEAGNSEKLGGVAASDYAKMTDLPDLATGVPAAETDPSVKAFAKSDITGVSGTSCPAGYVLTLDNNVVKCVVDGGGAGALPVATNAVLGGVMVPGTSDIAIDGSGNLTLKALATSKITGLDTALAGAMKYTDMPGASCAAGEALVWLTPSNTFSCFALTLDTAHVTGLDAALNAKLPLAGGTMTGDLNMGGKDVLATGHITMSNQKTITVGKYDQTQENTLAGTLTGANEGATWYNTAMKSLRFWDGTARQTVVSTTAACSDGQILKWNDTTKVWACSADSGAGGADASSIRGTDVSTVAPTTTGQVMRYNSVTSKWEASGIQASDLPNSIARSKVAAGTANHVLINDGSGNLSSEAQLAVSRGGTGQSTYTDGQVLIGKTDGTLAKSTITAGSGVTVTNGDGTITIAATGTAPSDASYTVKGIVQLLTNAATSGLNVSSGVISVNSGTAANQIVQLDGSARLPAVDGSALSNVTVSADKVTSGAGKYFTYAPNGAACTNGEVLKKTANGWECAADATGTAPGDASYAAKGIVQFNTDADTSGVSVASGVATLNTGTTANKIVKLDGSAKLPAVDGSALTNLDVSHIASASGKYLSYLPNGVACADGGVLKWDNSNTRWICGADAGSGGADASSIRGQAVDGVATAGIGNFMQHDGTKWTFVSMPQCTADKVLTFSAIGVATCENIAGLTNSAIAAGAAIDRTKVASGTANHVVINNGSGVLSSEAQLAVSRGGTGQSTYTDGQVLIGKTDGTLAKSTITAGSGVTVTNGDGTITIAATATAPSDASYSVKGIVQLLTNAATSGLNVSSGVISVNSGTGADQLVKLDGSAKLPAVDGSALTNVTVSADKVTSGAGKYFTYAPNGAACTNGEVLKKTANGWECAADATGTSPGDASYAAKGIVQFNTDADTSGVLVASGVATLNTGTTANKIVKLDGSAKLPAVDGSALTNLDVSHIASASGKYLSYLPNGAACADGGVLKWDNSNSRWICGTDAGAGGADASSIRGQAVDGVVTAGIGNFMQHDGTKWTFVSMPQCTADKVLTFSAIGVASCVSISGLTNSAIAAGAAIDRTKMASGTANHVIINNGSGVLSSEAQLAVSRGGTGQSTYTDGQVLIGKTDGTLAKSTITAGSGVTVTNGDGTITIAATATAPSDASYSTKGIVQLLTDASTSGLNVSSGVISVNTGTTAGQIVKLDGSAKLPAVDGSALTNVTVSADKVTSGAGKYFTYAPNNVACTNGDVLKKTANGWECAADATGSAPGDSSYAAKGIVQFNTDADTSGVSVASGVATLNTGTTANKIVKLDGSAKLPAVDGSALTNLDVSHIASASGKYFSYLPNGAACTDGGVLKWDNSNSRWICGTDAGAGGADASSIRGQAVDGVATAGIGNFMQHDGTKWTFVSMPQCTADKVLTFSAIGVASCVSISGLTNSAIAAGAAIDRTKMASGTANHVIINNGSGVLSSEAQLATSRGGTGQSTYTDGQILVGKTDGTLAKTTITAGSGVTVTNGDGAITIAATATAPSDASYSVKGIVQLLTNAATSGLNVSSGVISVNTGTSADQIVKLDGSAKLPAVDGSALTNLDATKITSGVLPVARGGTGQSTFTNGQILIGKTDGTLAKSTLTAGTNVTITNADGAITINAGGGSDTLSGLSCASGDVASWNGSAWVCQTTGSTNVASSIVKRSPSNAISAGVSDFTGVRIFDGVSGYITLQTPATVTSYSLTLPTGTGTNGQMLTTNGSGVLSWSTPAASLPALTSANMWVGNGSNVATAVAMSGDTTISNTGAVSIGSGKVTSTHILNGTIADTDISSTADIARSKIASGTNYGIVTNSSSGVMGAGIACSTVGHVLAWTAGGFTCQAPSASLPALSSANLWVGNGSSVATAVAASGDVTLANTGAFTVTKMQGRSISSSAPSAGQVLMYISSTWTPTSPTTSGAVSSLLQLDASGVATSLANAIKGATTGTATIQAPNSFTSYSLTLPADDGNANQVLTTNGSGTLTWTTPGGAPTITTKSADFTVSTGEDNYFYMISNATTATLPAVASVPAGFRATFKRIGGSNVNLVANGSETIDGATQRSLSSTYQTIAIINTGTEWAIIGGGATGTVSGCVPGSQSYPGAGSYTLTVDATKASKCKFTVTVQGGGGGSGASGGAGGRGGALSFVYTAPGAGTFEVYVGGAGALLSGGSGGGGTGGTASSKGGGGGGASAVRWTTTAPTDVLLAIAGGGGGGGATSGSNTGGNGGGVTAATHGGSSGSNEGGRLGGNNVGGSAGAGSTVGGAGGSSSGNGFGGSGGTPTSTGGTAVAAFSISGGGGGAGATTNACGAGGAGYGGGGGGTITTHYGGGGGGGGYINSVAVDSFTGLTGPAAQTSGSVLIEWN